MKLPVRALFNDGITKYDGAKLCNQIPNPVIQRHLLVMDRNHGRRLEINHQPEFRQTERDGPLFAYDLQSIRNKLMVMLKNVLVIIGERHAHPVGYSIQGSLNFVA